MIQLGNSGIQFPTHKRKRAQRKREIIQERKFKRRLKNQKNSQ
jgi:hypothetical protein